MGTWSRKLYGNDVTCDVRDTYIDFLHEQESNEDAENKTLNRYAEYMGTDEECLVWDAEGCNQLIFSRIHIFDMLFDEIPAISEIRGLRILPIDTPHRTAETLHVFPLNINAIMDFYKKSEYPEKRLTFLGNAEIEIKTPCYSNRAYYGWYRLEENWLGKFCLRIIEKEYNNSLAFSMCNVYINRG